MLTTSAHAITYDSGGACAELRRMPDGRWTVATGISVLSTGKSPWMPSTRDRYTNEDAATHAFLATLPADPALHARILEKVKGLRTED